MKNESSSSTTPLKLLLDTNVWLDYFLARSNNHSYVSQVIAQTYESEQVALYVTSLSLKDIAYQLTSYLKASVRHAGKTVTDSISSAARETAWGCLRSILDKAIIIPIGSQEVLQAFTYKQLHDDFEDDLILGAAYSIKADYLITHDQKLAKHAPLPCLTAKETLSLISERLDPE